MKKTIVLLLAIGLALPGYPEGLKDYKNLKHRPLKTDSSGKTVERPCTEVYVETCQRNCTNDACRAKCQQDAGPYCVAREKERREAETKILLYALLLISGPLLTLVDGPRNFGGDDPWTFYWDLPSFNLDLGVGLLSGSTYGVSGVGAFRVGYFGANVNASYLKQGTDALGELDAGPTFYLGSTHLSAGISPVLLYSGGPNVKAEYGFGVRTSTTAYFGPIYLVFSPLLGKINSVWQFALRAGVGYRFTPSLGAHLAYDHRSVLDLATLNIASASLNGAFLYLSFRFN